ncbi:MAG: DUF1772 domain-containing protein [Kineosporiaceae bacterium]
MSRRLLSPAHIAGYVAVLLTGAIFGFFYAWVVSTMWGLDAADPRVAVEAMREMNASVRNAAFFPAFFLTPAALAVAGLLARRAGRRPASALFLIAGAVYLVGGLLVTAIVNVPLNDELARGDVPASPAAAGAVWEAYSGRWQAWNLVRTVASGIALLLATVAVAASGVPRDSQGPASAARSGSLAV